LTDNDGPVASPANLAPPTERLVHFREWEGTVRDAISDVMHAPSVDSTRIGLFGTGLGGSLALSVAAQDKRVRGRGVRRQLTRLGGRDRQTYARSVHW
jgi:hypothetical protein